MNTKTFAQQARNILMKGVANKLLYWGFDESGEERTRPNAVQGGYMFRGEAYDDTSIPKKWNQLKSAIKKKGMEQVVEEAAYTWFNRMMAIRILAKNGHEQAQLEYVSEEQQLPLMVQRARRGQYDFLPKKDQARLERIIKDFSKDKEAFGLLLVGYCTSNALLKPVFGSVDDYTEMLLPDDILAENGFLHLLNTTDAISDEAYQEVELIGWLYQFYISERKDEVFASFKKKKKAEAKDIPAATQIFTPNWIVKYMVENTVGKLWLDLNPSSPLKGEMRYLVEGENPTYGDPIISEVAKIKLLDPACGSGHILVEGFDLLYQMYMEEYYPPQEAVESILKNNLFGLDIDDRAMQLARFAVLLKAAKHYPDILKAGILPKIYAMPAPRYFAPNELATFLGAEGKAYEEEFADALKLMYQAKNLGSTMQFDLSEGGLGYLRQRLADLDSAPLLDLMEQGVLAAVRPFVEVLLLLGQKYEAVVANPPYMGQKNMNKNLKDYVNGHYPLSKTDLFAVFMEVCLDLNVAKGLMGMINQHSWMFLSSFNKLRAEIVNNYGIVNMLHLGPRTFDELSGEVVQSTAFVLENGQNINHGNYYRLIKPRNSSEKRNVFLKGDNSYFNILQSNFFKIPGSPIAYWISQEVFSSFENNTSLGDTFFKVTKGIFTGDNKRFIRFWFEINKGNNNWKLYNKAGGARKWYGIANHVLDWRNNGEELLDFKGAGMGARKYYGIRHIVWSGLSSGAPSFRIDRDNIWFDDVSPAIIDENIGNSILGLLNSKVIKMLLNLINPTLHYQVGDIKKIPLPLNYESEKASLYSIDSVNISSRDWNSHEFSWGFNKSPMLKTKKSLKETHEEWQRGITQDFFQLHNNEEKLNRIFIKIYGLQEELTPDVPLKDITILQEELDRKALEELEPIFREQGKEAIELPIKKDVVMQQLLSYAVGVFMGRYRLDQEGLQIAHPNPSAEEIAPYLYNGQEIEIDDDAIIPLMGAGSDFPDDAINRFKGFLDAVWGEDTRIENLNFLQECLNMDLEKYFLKHFWKDHCKRYKKKPIYWLFSSKKGAFQVLVYMHRMNAFTVEKIRANYLMPHLKTLRSKIEYLENNESSLDQKGAKDLDKLRKDLLECEGYDMDLKEVADQQIDFDLDDGVTVNYAKFGTVVAKIK